jgi:transcriptional regulator with XRE-family HTH domain
MSRKPPSALDRNLARFLKSEMSKRGLTYREMAREIGCSYSSVHRTVNLETSASLQLVQQVCNAFKVSIHDIVPRKST